MSFISKWFFSMQKILICHWHVLLDILQLRMSSFILKCLSFQNNFSACKKYCATSRWYPWFLLRNLLFSFFLLLGKVLFCGSFPDFSLVWLSGVMKMYLDIDCLRFGILCSLVFIQLLESVGLYLLSDLSSFQSLFLQGLFQPSPSGTLSIPWFLIGSYSSLSLHKEGLCYLFLASSGWIFYGPLWIK